MRRRPDRPDADVLISGGEPLELRVRFPPGAIMQPDGAPAGPEGVACPYCRRADVILTSHRSLPSGGRVYYYRCNVCVDRETRDYSRFKRLRRSPSPAPRVTDPPSAGRRG